MKKYFIYVVWANGNFSSVDDASIEDLREVMNLLSEGMDVDKSMTSGRRPVSFSFKEIV